MKGVLPSQPRPSCGFEALARRLHPGEVCCLPLHKMRRFIGLATRWSTISAVATRYTPPRGHAGSYRLARAFPGAAHRNRALSKRFPSLSGCPDPILVQFVGGSAFPARKLNRWT